MFKFQKRYSKDPESVMRTRLTCFVFVWLFCLSFGSVCQAQEQGYFAQMGHTFTRGLKNLVSFPWEVPATIAKHDREDNGNPRLFRDTAGFFDGTFRAITRLGCGAWDVIFCLVPGQQDELPLTPKTLF
jgi:hypothetical protein